MPGDRGWRYTQLGRRFYSSAQMQYIVEVPVIIQVTDKNGKQRTRTNEHLPVNMLGLGQILMSQALSDAEKEARIKSMVLKHLGGPTRAGRTVLMEDSGQRFSYDRDGKWLISAMGTTVDAQGRPQTQAVLHQDLSLGEPLKGRVMGAAFLPHAPDCYLDEAFEEHPDCLCVPRQLAVLLRQTTEDICSILDGLLPDGWRNQGVRPEEVERFCALFGHPYFLVRAGKLVKIVEPPQKLGRAIALCVYDGHAFFYKSARTVRDWGCYAKQDACFEKRGGLLSNYNNPSGEICLTNHQARDAARAQDQPPGDEALARHGVAPGARALLR
jgi:hypothetical protein